MAWTSEEVADEGHRLSRHALVCPQEAVRGTSGGGGNYAVAQCAGDRGRTSRPLDPGAPRAVHRGLCSQAGIPDLTLVEFRGPEPGTVKVSGGGHSLSMTLPFVPDAVLGPWLLAHRDDGNIWTSVYRPQPTDANGTVLPPMVSAR